MENVNNETDVLLKATGSLKPNFEYKKWLHLWTMSTENDGGHVEKHLSFPWVALWDKPDLSSIMATYHITDFVNFPASWETLWYDLDEMIEDLRSSLQTRRHISYGPHWVLLPQPGIAHLAREIADMNRRVMRDMFNKMGPVGSTKVVRSIAQRELKHALEPFRVLSPSQELEDETVRSAEERRDAVRVGDRPPLNRPPRCR